MRAEFRHRNRYVIRRDRQAYAGNKVPVGCIYKVGRDSTLPYSTSSPLTTHDHPEEEEKEEEEEQHQARYKKKS